MELAEGCVICLEARGGEAATPASAPLSASAAFSSPAAFHVAISSSSMGETPLLRKRTLLLRNFRQTNSPPTSTSTPTTESTALKVIVRVLLLPRPEVLFLFPEAVSLAPSSAAAEVDEVDMSEDTAMIPVPVLVVVVGATASEDDGLTPADRTVRGTETGAPVEDVTSTDVVCSPAVEVPL